MCPIGNLLCAVGRCGRALIPVTEQHGCHDHTGINAAGAGAVADAVVEARPDVVGSSCYVWNVTTLAAADVLRAHPGARLIRNGDPRYVAPRIRSATRTTSAIAATPCTRTIWAPCSTLAVTAAAVPHSRADGSRSPRAT